MDEEERRAARNELRKEYRRIYYERRMREREEENCADSYIHKRVMQVRRASEAQKRRGNT